MAKKSPKPKKPPRGNTMCWACSLGRCGYCYDPRCICRRNGH